MLVTVRLFARLRELAGAAELTRELPEGATALNAWQSIAREFPVVASYERAISCAVNEEYARMNTVLHDGDDVAFLPPVSGGAHCETVLNETRIFQTRRGSQAYISTRRGS